MLENEYHEMSTKEDRHWWFIGRRFIIDIFLKKLSLKKNAEILDIGSGTGSNINLLSKYGQLSIMEPNYIAHGYLKKKYFDIDKLKVGSCPEHLEYSKKFDLVSLFDVLEHIEEDALTLDKIYNILNLNGYIIITVPAYQWLWSDHDIRLMHKRRYNLTQIKKIIPKNLKIEQATYFNTLLFPLAVIERIIKKTFKTKDKSDNFFINFILKFIFKLERKLLNFINFPYGLSILIVLKKNN